MPYRICTIDSTGKITSISSTAFESSGDVIAEMPSLNPKAYAFIDESQLTDIITQQLVGDDDLSIGESDGVGTKVVVPEQRSYQYDPRTEVVLYIPNTDVRFTHGERVIQDITKTQVYYNTVDTSTIPIHSTTQKKFGPSSGKFTKSFLGYTGAGIYVTNISKTDYVGGYTAPHNNVAVNASASYAMELFFYPTSASNNFVLMEKGRGGTSANWKLGYDSSAGFLQFAWQSYGSTGGYNYSQNIVNTTGMTLNTWHHVAVAVVKNTSGVNYLISGYFNGLNVFSQSVTLASFPEVRYDNGIYIGNNYLGSEAFDGYIDCVRVLESGNTSGLFSPTGYGFLPFGGGTLSLPTSGFTRTSQTAFVMNFNGVDSNSNFFAESKDYIAGTVTRVANISLTPGGGVTSSQYVDLGVREIARYTLGYTAGMTGYSDPTGFSMNYGHVVLPYVNPVGSTSNPAYNDAGYDYSYPLYGIFDNDLSLNVYRVNYRTDILYDRNKELIAMIEGAYGNRGSSGSIFRTAYGTNPFGRLFSTGSGNSYGVGLAHNSLYIDPLNRNTMNYIMENGYLASQGISSASYTFVDGRGYTRNITSADIINLRLDIMEHQNRIKNSYLSADAQMVAAATEIAIKSAKFNKTGSSYQVASLPK